MEQLPLYRPGRLARWWAAVAVWWQRPSAAPRCRVCGRRLLSPASRKMGIGPTCARRLARKTSDSSQEMFDE